MDTVHWRRALPALALVLALLATACSSARSTVKVRPTVTPTAASGTPTATATPQPPTWDTVAFNLPPSTRDVEFAPTDPQTAYLCAFDWPAASLVTAAPRLYTSTDGGQHWRPDDGTPMLTPVAGPGGYYFPGCSITVDAADARDVFLQLSWWDPQGAGSALARSLYRSRDGGATWQTLTALDRTDGFSMLAVLGSRLIATPHFSINGAGPCDPAVQPVASTILRASDDGGLTWHEIGQAIESQGYSPGSLAVAGSAIFTIASLVPTAACTQSSGEKAVRTLWRSVDGGDTWSLVTLPDLPYFGDPAFTAKANGSGYYGLLVARDATTITTLYSADSGATWTALAPLIQPNYEYNPNYFSPLVVAPSGAVIAQLATTSGSSATTLGPIYVWRPGATSMQFYAFGPPSLLRGISRVRMTRQGTQWWLLLYNLGDNLQIATLPLP